MSIHLHVCAAGSCTHPEHVILRTCSLRIRTMPAMFLILEHPREGLALYDTGYSQAFFRVTARFPEKLYALVTPAMLDPGRDAVAQLAVRGYRPDDVRRVFISHFHADHIAALSEFPRARFVCLADAYESVRRRSRFSGLRKGFLRALIPRDFDERLALVDALPTRALPEELLPFTRGYDLFGDGSVIGVRLDGHARGQLGLLVEASDAKRYFFVADACWLSESFEQNLSPHPITRLLFDDVDAYARSLQALHTLHRRAGSTVIVPSHCTRALSGLSRLEVEA